MFDGLWNKSNLVPGTFRHIGMETKDPGDEVGVEGKWLIFKTELLGPSYTIPDHYRSGVTFVSDRGLSYTMPYQNDTQRSD